MNGLIEVEKMLKGYEEYTPAEREFMSWLDRRRTIFINQQLNQIPA